MPRDSPERRTLACKSASFSFFKKLLTNRLSQTSHGIRWGHLSAHVHTVHPHQTLRRLHMAPWRASPGPACRTHGLGGSSLLPEAGWAQLQASASRAHPSGSCCPVTFTPVASHTDLPPRPAEVSWGEATHIATPGHGPERHGPRVATRKQKPRPASEANAPCAPRGTSCPQGLAPAQPRHTCVRFQLGRGRVVSLQTGMLLGRGRDAGAKAGPSRPRRPGRPPPRGARNRADGQLGPHAACWRFRPARRRPATDFTTRHTLGVTSPTAASPENKRMP